MIYCAFVAYLLQIEPAIYQLIFLFSFISFNRFNAFLRKKKKTQDGDGATHL